MPGVPSGRGCEACRKQKKKCDQAKPACGRCARLEIQCIGAGVRRFHFREFSATPSQGTSTAGGQSAVMLREPTSSPTLLLSQEFIQAFRGDDMRYDISIYGHFLQGIPGRLGRNKALDASTSAVAKSLAAYRRGQPSCTVALTSYIQALGALRSSLADPATAGTAETLCSIYLIVLCQGWIGSEDIHILKHGEAIAFILRRASSLKFDGVFENQLVLTLIVPLVMNAMMNPNIVLGPWLDELLDKYMVGLAAKQPTTIYESCSLRNIVKMPSLIRDPLRHMPYIGVAYETVRGDVARMRQSYALVQNIYESSSATAKTSKETLRMYSGMQTVAGIILMLANLFAGFLAAHDRHNTAVIEEATSYRQETLTLAKAAAIHRPFGSSYMTLTLVTAWAASEDAEEMAELWTALEDYASDFPEDHWQERPMWLRSVFDTVRRDSFIRASGVISPASDIVAHKEYCVMM